MAVGYFRTAEANLCVSAVKAKPAHYPGLPILTVLPSAITHPYDESVLRAAARPARRRSSLHRIDVEPCGIPDRAAALVERQSVAPVSGGKRADPWIRLRDRTRTGNATGADQARPRHRRQQP